MRDPIELEIFKNIYHSIAEEMGAALRRTAFSPNIKERRDYSCAVFDPDGEVIAMGDHMPVHIGSMPMSVRAAVEAFSLGPGDMVMLIDPFRSGTYARLTSAKAISARRLQPATPELNVCAKSVPTTACSARIRRRASCWIIPKK